MASNLAIRDGWFVRVLRALKLVAVSPEGEVDHSAGADFLPNLPSTPGYDPLASLSSMARFPWVYAAVTAIATDLSKVPIRVTKGTGADAEPLPDHPVMQLIQSPSTRVPGILFWRQVITDLVLTGDAFILIAGSAQPEALLRLHPSRVRIMPQADGQPGEYEYQGGGAAVRYGYEQVLHIRTPSWADSPQSLWGVGAIQSLHADLLTDLRTQELTAASASTGRPTGIISPSEEGDRWSTDQIRVLRDAYEKQMSSGSGLLVMGGALNYTPVGWSPKDMEFASVRQMTREAVLAALDCPPTRVGLPSANYATSKEQAKRYWEGLSGKSALIASELTRLVQMFPDSDDVTCEYDFSEVEALQESRTDRLNRVMTWATLGVPIAEAAAYEGFDDLPTDNLLAGYDAPAQDPAESEEPEPEADNDEGGIKAEAFGWFDHTADVCEDVETREGRLDYMLRFLQNVHSPYERALNLAVRRHLRGQSARTAKRLAEAMPERRAGDPPITKAYLGLDWLMQILGVSEESRLLEAATRPIITQMVRQSVSQALRQAGATDIELTPEWIGNQVDAFVYDMVEHTNQHTGQVVEETLEQALANGSSIAEMQDELMQSHAFSAERALRIARTETTKAVNRGTSKTYEALADRGVDLEIVWMASPGARDAHRALDGQRIEAGGKFVVPPEGGKWAGQTASHPGGFGVAGLDINCRCTISTRIKRK